MTDTDKRAHLVELKGPTTATRSSNYETSAQLNKLIDDVDALRVNIRTQLNANAVVSLLTAGLSVDTAAQDVETDNAITIRHNGSLYNVAAASAIDISTLAGGGATVATSTTGVLWVFANTAGTFDAEVDKDAQDYSSAVAAWAAWATATNTLPPGADDVPVGAVVVTEGGSGAFTWGTDSITAETESYVDLFGTPAVETAVASLALDTGAATFTYGAGVVRLGSGVRVALTGKAGVTLSGSNVATGAVGAWLLYALADDVEFAKQLDNDYTSLLAAQRAVRDHNRNPYLAWFGTLYVENNSGANFVPGTTTLDKSGITCTFVINGHPHALLDSASDLTAARVAGTDGTVIA